MERYYTPEQMQQFGELRKRTPEEEIQAIEEDRSALIADVRVGMLLPPESPEAVTSSSVEMR